MFGQSTLILLNLPVWHFRTVYFDTFGSSTFDTLIHHKDRPLLVEWPSTFTHDHPLWLKRPSTIVLDRPLLIKWPSSLPQDRPLWGPSTFTLLDRPLWTRLKNIPKHDSKSVTKSFISFQKKSLRHPIFRGGPAPPKFSNFEFSFSPFLILSLEVTYVRIWANSEQKKSYLDMFFWKISFASAQVII